MWIFLFLYILDLGHETDIFNYIVDSTLCLRNEDIGHRPGNIYRCDDPVRTSCCERSGEFTCCEPSKTKYLLEQLKLWGCVLLFVLILVLMYVYFSKDVQVFSSPTAKKSLGNIMAMFHWRSTDAPSRKTGDSVTKDSVTTEL